jgi:hypothetical protein
MWESAVNIQWNHQCQWNLEHIWKIRVHFVYGLVSSMYHKCQVVIFSVTLRCYVQNSNIKQMPRQKGLLSTWLSSVLRCGLSPCSTGALRNLCSNSCSALHLCCSSFKRHLVNYKKEISLLSKYVITRIKLLTFGYDSPPPWHQQQKFLLDTLQISPINYQNILWKNLIQH